MTVYLLATFGGVMKTIGGIALAVAVLLAMVTIHEFGHYIVGKRLGFKINEFSVGFGPALFKKRSKKTGELFALRLIPLGGYCAFDGEDEADEEPAKTDELAENEGGRVELSEEKSVDELFTETRAELSEETAEERKEEAYPEPKGERFNNQPPWKRILVLLAGAVMNYLLALIIIVFMFAFAGRPTYEVVKVKPGENADAVAVETYHTGLQTGDEILKIDGRGMYLITDYMDALDGKKKGETVEVLVLRNEKEVLVEVSLLEDVEFVNMSDTDPILFSLGIATRNNKGETTRGGGLEPEREQMGFFQTVGGSFAYSFKIGGTILRSLGELLTGKMGLDAMGGPVTTVKVTSQAASSGAYSFFNIAALIGVNLAVFNLLPIPALDGCKIIFCIIEWIRKKPVNRKVEAIIHFAGIIFLFGFAILVDLLQLF